MRGTARERTRARGRRHDVAPRRRDVRPGQRRVDANGGAGGVPTDLLRRLHAVLPLDAPGRTRPRRRRCRRRLPVRVSVQRPPLNYSTRPNRAGRSPASSRVPRALTRADRVARRTSDRRRGYAGSGDAAVVGGVFDPGIGGWILNGALHTPRAGHTTTRLTNGTVLVAGGISADGRTTAAEIYIPEIGFSTNTSIPFRQGLADGARMPVSARLGRRHHSEGPHIPRARARRGTT